MVTCSPELFYFFNFHVNCGSVQHGVSLCLYGDLT